MTRAAREMTEAARGLRLAVDRLAEIQFRSTAKSSVLAGLLGAGGLSEEEAATLAVEERPLLLTSEEIREWGRRRREGYYQRR